tara:strand:- start:712 stop:1443 length:732 start_codon:yes stop_codon:yes gene_type:complete
MNSEKLIVLFIVSLFCFGQTPCFDAVANATGIIGEFIPQCEEDGSYSPIQCWSSTGYCWCVDENGIEIPGTSLGPGEGLPNCNPAQINLCDSIDIEVLDYDPSTNIFQVNIDMLFTSQYWFGYCGLMITNNQGDTIALENINSAGNVYGLGPGMNEVRYLEVQPENINFPINGQVHLVESFFAGNGDIACSWPLYFEEKINSLKEIPFNQQKTKIYNLLGQEIIIREGLYIEEGRLKIFIKNK